MENGQSGKTWHATVDKSGRVLLPAELRQLMRATPGTQLVWMRSGDGVKLQPFDDVLTSVQQYFQGLSPADESWSDEMLRERRDEPSRE